MSLCQLNAGQKRTFDEYDDRQNRYECQEFRNGEVAMSAKKYSYEPQGFFRTAFALRRMMREGDYDKADVEDAAIVEFAFNRSRWGRKIARWDLLAQEVAKSSPEAAVLMKKRVRLPALDINALAALPVGTFGHEFALHAMERGISPNPVETMPAPDDGDWLMAYMYETHDLWHVMTGFYYDMEGEFGVAGFYMGQMPKFSFIAFFSSLLMIRAVWNDRDIIPQLVNAFVEGYTMGRNARCLVGLDWSTIYDRDLAALRAEWGIEEAGKFPELQRAA